MSSIIDNSPGATGVVGILVGISPNNPSEWLICLSTMLVLVQLSHWGYRLFKWCRKKRGIGMNG